MGFRLVDNFNRPYFAKSISEFWRRWHISLSSWFRDYIFFPMRRSFLRSKVRLPDWLNQMIPTLVTMLLSGLWHGANWTFVVWGALHGGYILVSTDPNYEPQSFLNTSGKRPAETKCPSDALTTAEMQGFDVSVAAELGKRLGVETCFATPDWDVITAGSWADKWDVSVGSMTVTTDRQKVLDFSVPYYYTPAVVAVRGDSGITDLAGLEGQALCAGAATTYEAWLN